MNNSKGLKFSERCAKLAQIGFNKVNLIFANFETKNVNFLVELYKVFVRSSLQYASEVWSPYMIKDIELLERVQRLFTRRLFTLS